MNPNRSRTVAVVVIVVAFVLLATFALLARSYRPGRDGVEVPSALVERASRVVGPLSPATARVLSGTLTTDEVTVVNVAAPAPTPAPAAPITNVPDEPPTTNGLPPCPLGLPVPTEPAGLANLVGLVPLFGPFSPEAFAFVPAFEPGFPLMGPLIIAGGEQLDANAEAMNALVGILRPLEQAGFDAISPLYEPYRQQVLDAETALANGIRPGVAAFAAIPGSSCFPALLAAAMP